MGFPRPILFETLPVPESDVLRRRHLRHKGLHQRGLTKE
jgi:hypothetical protein